MWRSRLREISFSICHNVDAGYMLSNTHYLGYDIYKLLPAVFYIPFIRIPSFSILALPRFCFSGQQKSVGRQTSSSRFLHRDVLDCVDWQTSLIAPFLPIVFLVMFLIIYCLSLKVNLSLPH